MKVCKLASLALTSTSLLGSLPHQASALRCGIKGVTKDCLGDSDIRYDPEVNYDLVNMDTLYQKLPGLYIVKNKEYLGDGTPDSNRTFAHLWILFPCAFHIKLDFISTVQCYIS